jgi:pilus assembly protein FimV
MSRPLCPILLIASAALPSAALALGLGDLHVESALGQQFVAHIDLIDASPSDLGRLQADIADEDIFQRNQLARPGFLAGTTVTVGQDARGQPILLLRSKDSFTEPVVTFLVDVRWRTGELIREYTALLDPSELASRTPDATLEGPRATPETTRATSETPRAAAETPRVAPAAPEATPQSEAPAVQTSATHTTPLPASAAPLAATAPDHKPQLRSYKVARGDTLVRIAIAAGARSRKVRHRMMIAIYRANPAVFHASLNTLRTGEVLRLPTAEELAAISPADAEREYQAQLAAMHETGGRKPHWHSGEHAVGVVQPKADPASLEADKSALSHRVESLEQSLQEVRRELQERTRQTTPPPHPVRAAPAPEPAVTVTEHSVDSAPPMYRRASFIALISGLGLMLAAGWWWVFGRRRDDHPTAAQQAAAPDSRVAAESQTAVPSEAEILARNTAASMPIEPLGNVNRAEAQADIDAVISPAISLATAPRETEGQVDTGDTTAVLAPDMEAFGDTVEHKFSFYNPESHFDTTHVVMGSELTRPLAFVERRKNPAIVLQQAIEREPHRSDLHLKLLELYYASASENRLAFLEAARQIMHRQGLVSAEDWARIAAMGRQIAPDDELFRTDLDDQAVA